MMVGKRALVAVTLTTLLFGASGQAWAQLCYVDSDESNPGNGVPVKWASTPIDVYWYVNGGNLPAKADVVTAIKAAFDAYAAIDCTTLSFNYAGEIAPADLSVNGKDGAIVVYFGHDSTDWVYGTSAYFHQMKFKTLAAGDINIGIIAMNARDETWVNGAEANKIDIQTAVMQMIPLTLGFYVGGQPGGNLPGIKYNDVNHTVSADQIEGAKYSYFDTNDTSCTKPSDPAVCASGTSTGDGGTTTGDGGTTTGDGGTTTTKDGGGTTNNDGGGTTNNDAGVIGTDGSTPAGDGGGSGADDGCCRISQAHGPNLPWPSVMLVGLLFVIFRVRRRRR